MGGLLYQTTKTHNKTNKEKNTQTGVFFIKKVYFLFFAAFFVTGLPDVFGIFLNSCQIKLALIYATNADNAVKTPPIISPPAKYKKNMNEIANTIVYCILFTKTLPNF